MTRTRISKVSSRFNSFLMTNLSLIAAVADNGAIGKDNDLLCHLPNDLKHFKALTLGHTVVMGRRTFESLPAGPLPRRRNVVLSSRPGQLPDTVSAYASLPEALASAADEEELFIIGGATLYKAAIDDARQLYITEIHHDFPDADTFFPAIDPAVWEEVVREDFPADDRHAYPYSFVTYRRR